MNDENNVAQFDDDVEMDLDELQESFEAEWVDESDAPESDDVESEPETEDESESEPESEPEPEPESEDEEQKEPPAQDLGFTQKQNEAFKKMREENKRLMGYAEFVKQAAEQAGMTPEELMKTFEENKLQEQAEEQNIPVDVLKRINQLEAQHKQAQQELWKREFDAQVQAVREKYEATDDQLMATMVYMDEQKLPMNFPFEDAYKIVHHDAIIQQQVNALRQQELEEKKKRQEAAIPPVGSGDVVDHDDLDREVQEFLRESGAIDDY